MYKLDERNYKIHINTMRTKINQLNDQKSTLETAISNADSNWKDSVKENFFSLHIQPIRQIFPNQIDAMERVVSVFEQAERDMEQLLKEL